METTEKNTSSNESLLSSYYNLNFDDSIIKKIKESKGVLKDIEYNNEFLIHKTPKKLKYLMKDGSIINLSHKYYCYYIEVNNKTGKHTIKRLVNNFLMVFNEETGELDEIESKDNLETKVTYDLAQIEKKKKGTISIIVEAIKADPVDKGLHTYEVTFLKHKGGKDIKTVKADDVQIGFMTTYLLKKNIKKYSEIKKVLKVDFAKTYWARLFTSRKKRKVMGIKELHTFTFKMYKIYQSRPSISFPVALKELIRTTHGNIRATAIELYDITEKDTLPDPYGAIKRMNQKDLYDGNPVNFDDIYVAMVRLSDGQTSSVSMSEIFFNLAEIIERRVFLRRSVKQAMKKPVFTIIFLLGIAVFTVKSFAPILFEIYTGIGQEPPPVTMAFNAAIDWTFQYFYFVFFFLYLIYTLYVFFAKHSFYGIKAMNNIFLTIPLFGGFFKRSEYEILLAVASKLYAGSRGHGDILPVIQGTLVNYHIKGVINTAAINFNNYKTNPGIVFDKFPQYIDTRISSLFKVDKIDTQNGGEIDQLRNTFKLDNDEFIENLNGIISNVMLIVAGVLLMGIIFATIVPMIELATAI